MAGLTPAGFEAKTAAEILADIEAAQKASLGADLDVSPEQPLGQINGIVAAKLRELWEALGLVYVARIPAGASGASLEGIGEITALSRLGATYGTTTLTVILGAGRTLAAGAVASVTGQPTNRWVTTAAATNASGAQASVSVAARAESPGLQRANAGTISVIATPVTGWVGVTNAADAIPGAAAETDPALRRRRAETIRAGGSSPLDAVRRAIADVTDVTQVRVFENATDFVDADGRPPHSLDVLVVGGTDQAVADALWSAKAAGIRTWGSTSRTVTDSGGTARSVSFSRPSVVNVYVAATVERDPSVYPTAADLLAVVGPALAAVGDLLQIGEPVRVELLRSTIFRLPGVIDVPSVRLGRTASPTGTANLSIGRRELADLDSSRVTVAVV
jgi:uncharacterized phage protein gp47/JayE